jgi:uncharacterized protein
VDGEWFGWGMKFILFIFTTLFLTCGLSALDFQETKKLAEGGDASAQYNLGTMYFNGAGVPQDYKEGVKWYKMAAEQGNALAQCALGVIYGYNGNGVSKDWKEAVKWYRMSAKQGNARAQYHLGIRYFSGSGVPKDYKQAYAWYSIAKTNGNEDAGENLDLLTKEMTKDQIADAQSLSTEIYNRIEANRKD